MSDRFTVVRGESVDSRRYPPGFWLQDALEVDASPDAPALRETTEADVCIVGGGYTGLWTALHLKEAAPELDVVLVEADICGGGPSGRNGGFVLSWWSKFAKLEQVCAAEEALRLARLSADAVDAIGRFCREHEIDAEYNRDGWYWTATTPSQLGAWSDTIRRLGEHGATPFREVEQSELLERTGSRGHLAGVFEASAASVQPARLVRGLRRVALARGVRIYERSPMVRLERSSPPVVTTPSGSVRATKVVLGLHAWLAQIRELERCLFIVTSDVVATAPIPDLLDAVGLEKGVVISDSRLLPIYYHATVHGRVVFGKASGNLAYAGRITQRQNGPPSTSRLSYALASLHALYPALGRTSVHSVWTGPVDRSYTGLPYFGRLDGAEDVYYGGGYSGNGVGPSYLAGRVLSSLVREVDDEWSAIARSLRARPGLPPEPVRYLGGRLVQGAIRRKERLEDEGRKPGPLVSLAPSLVPGTFVPKPPRRR